MNLHTLFLSNLSQTALEIARYRDHGFCRVRKGKWLVRRRPSFYARGNAMSNESRAQLSELRDLVHQNWGQLNRAALEWIGFARKALDAAEANVAAFCDHARRLADAGSPAECVKLQSEFLKASFVALQKQSTNMVRTEGSAAE
jgi:Phasin protein